MTNLLLSSCLIMLGMINSCHAQVCGLYLHSQNGEKFSLSVNNKLRSEDYAPEIRLLDLTTDVQRLQVTVLVTGQPKIDKSLYLKAGQVEHYLITKGEKGRYELVFEKYEPLPAAAPKNPDLSLRTEKKTVTEANGTQTTTVTKTSTCTTPMPQHTFELTLNSVERLRFDKDKLDRAKSALEGACLSAAQLQRIADAIPSEQSRLELMQFSYPWVIDKPNFPALINSFSDSTLIRQFRLIHPAGIKGNGKK